MDIAPASLLTETAKEAKRKHVVYRLISSSLPLQFPDSHKDGNPYPS